MEKMKKPFIALPLLVVVSLMLPGSPAVAENPNDILIVANQGVSVDSVSIKDLKAIFLKRRANWKNGGKVIPIHAKEGTEIRNAFVERVLGMDSVKERAYWQEVMVKSGTRKPPEFSNTLKAVFKLRGGVSYIYRSQYRDGVSKILLVISPSS